MILVSLTVTSFSEKKFIFTKCPAHSKNLERTLLPLPLVLLLHCCGGTMYPVFEASL